MNIKLNEAIKVISEISELFKKDGWDFAQIGIKEWAIPREEWSFAVATLHKFEGALPCILSLRSTPVGSELEVQLEYPPELNKFKYLPEYANLLRQIRIPVAKGGEFVYEKFKDTAFKFFLGFQKAYHLYRGEIELKKLKLTVIKRLASIFKIDLGELDYEKPDQEFSAVIERKTIGPTIQIKVKTDETHNIKLELNNLTEEEGVKILSFLYGKNARN